MDLFTYVGSQNVFLCGEKAKIRKHGQYKTPRRTYIFSQAHIYVHRKTSGRLHRKPSIQDRKWEMVVKKAFCKRRRKRESSRCRENKVEPGLVLAWMPNTSFVALCST